ncbi:MAG: ABC transporter ATP-binding protein [Candidatus Omnitrophica bacterium]|nr:ABC transporter ATP-binding protein [Candidatus Omnitrophota bacterium]
MIDVQFLTMHYGPVVALDRLSFQANPGEVLGLLGPNGAGKTTAMRILTTYLYPTSGTALVDGIDIRENPVEARKRTGYLPETVPLYGDMQVDEYLSFVGKARGLRGKRLAERMEWVKEACQLKKVWKHFLSELSKGFGQRTGLAQALIHDPKVLILDEPTSGLDPIQIIEIRALIKSLAKEKTVIFSTHILQEVEVLADRIVILNEGKRVAQGTKRELALGFASQGKDPQTMSLEEIFIQFLAPQKAGVL